jgi:NifU-like protein
VWQNRRVSFYPKAIADAVSRALSAARVPEPVAEGVAASLECGGFIRFFLHMEGEDQVVSTHLSSNGCGYMIGAAETIAGIVNGKSVRELRGLDPADISERVYEILGDFPDERQHCCQLAVDALAGAFAAFRRKRIEEFSGEKALICTCFGISEDAIESLIRERGMTEISKVSEACNAGSGCGSCRMLIQEMIDAAVREA